MNSRPLQRPSTNKKPDNRKSVQSKSSAGGKTTKKGSTSAPTSSRLRRPGMNGNPTDASQSKEDEPKEEEPAEEERRFEASNHMDGDLVDVLGKEFYSHSKLISKSHIIELF